MAYRDPAVRRQRDRERFRRRTEERIGQGLCPRCGERPPEPERSVCDLCADCLTSAPMGQAEVFS